MAQTWGAREMLQRGKTDEGKYPTVTRRDFCTGLASMLALPVVGATEMTSDSALRPHRIRHYVMAVPDLEATCQEIYDFLDLSPTPPREGPGPTDKFGFTTRMMQIGDSLIEVVQPIWDKHLLHDWMSENGGPGGYMVVMQTYNAEALKSRASLGGLKLTRDMMFRGQHMIQFDYRHFATHFELYEYTPEENWWGDPLNKDYPVPAAVSEILGCEVAVDDPEKIATEIAELFMGERRGLTVSFGEKSILFTEARDRRRGLMGLDFQTKQAKRRGEHQTISGLEFRLV